MAEDSHNTSDISDYVEVESAREDAETLAARRELKQTSISGRGGARLDHKTASDDEDGKRHESLARSRTPEVDSRDAADKLKDQISSPKKKRPHDHLDEPKETVEGASANDETSAGDAAALGRRTDRSEPEKKRPRDKSAAGTEGSGEVGSLSPPGSNRSGSEKPSSAPTEKTDPSAFAKSAFAKLASSTASPFGTLGSSGKPSVFASGPTTSQSPFASAAATGAPKLSFGGAASSAAPSPFANLNGQATGFKSGLGGGGAFGGVLSGPRLSTFAKPGESFKSEKPAKPFGAPDSDAEDQNDDKDDEVQEPSVAEEGSDKEEEKDKDEAKASGEDKKKTKLQKVFVDDGEAGEVTLLQVRAKMYQMEKGVGWKERGAGMLKINVPHASVEFDKTDTPRPETFDASVLEAEDDEGGSKGRKSVRLVMRQDHTLRVILNTAILPLMDFNLTKKLKSALVLFTAFDGNEISQVQMKMSEANATAFTNLVEAIKKELRDI